MCAWNVLSTSKPLFIEFLWQHINMYFISLVGLSHNLMPTAWNKARSLSAFSILPSVQCGLPFQWLCSVVIYRYKNRHRTSGTASYDSGFSKCNLFGSAFNCFYHSLYRLRGIFRYKMSVYLLLVLVLARYTSLRRK